MSEYNYQLIQAIENCGYTPYYDYSGRSMYGRKCFGFVGDGNSGKMLMKVLGELVMSVDLPEYILDLQNCREDSMGHSCIVYFPGLQIQDPEDDDSDE